MSLLGFGVRCVPTRWEVRRRVDFEFFGSHGRTYVERLGGYGSKRFCRHLSVWFGQTAVQGRAGKPKPRFTLSIDLYREPPR